MVLQTGATDAPHGAETMNNAPATTARPVNVEALTYIVAETYPDMMSFTEAVALADEIRLCVQIVHTHYYGWDNRCTDSASSYIKITREQALALIPGFARLDGVRHFCSDTPTVFARVADNEDWVSADGEAYEYGATQWWINQQDERHVMRIPSRDYVRRGGVADPNGRIPGERVK